MTLLVVVVTVLTLGVALATLLARLALRLDAAACTPEWFDSFSLDSYAPMERLLNREDFIFLAGQPGYRPKIAKRLLAERRRAFLGYLRDLIRDFHQLLSFARLMIVYSSEDRREFAAALWRQRMRFYFVVVLTVCRVALFPLGLRAEQIRSLVGPLSELHGQIQQFTDARVEAVHTA